MSIATRGVEQRCNWQEQSVEGHGKSDGEDSGANKTYSAIDPHCRIPTWMPLDRFCTVANRQAPLSSKFGLSKQADMPQWDRKAKSLEATMTGRERAGTAWQTGEPTETLLAATRSDQLAGVSPMFTATAEWSEAPCAAKERLVTAGDQLGIWTQPEGTRGVRAASPMQ
jgi:hypothetical protein